MGSTHQTTEDLEAQGGRDCGRVGSHQGNLNVGCDADLCFKEAQCPGLDRRNMMRSDVDPHAYQGNVFGHVLTIPHLVVRHRRINLVTRRRINSAY